MNKSLRRLSLAGCLLFLGMGVLTSGLGCSSAGNNFDINNVRNIVKGTTTKKDVLQYFGDPLRKEISPNGEVWTYTYVETNTTALGVLGHVTVGVDQSQSTANTLVIVFDGDVVKNYDFNNGSHTDTYLPFQ